MIIRRSLVVGVAAAVLLAAAPLAVAQTVDDIVAKNLDAKGGLAKMRTVQTMKQTSRMTMQGTETTLTMYGKRPNLVRQEVTVQGQTIVMAYDGTTPWAVNPLLGSSSPVVVTGPQAAMIREQSAFDGPLVDYKERGAKVELVGTEALGNAKVFHLKMTSKAGQIQHVYIDTTTFLEVKLVSEEMGRLEQELMDYRDVNGIKVPFHIRVTQNGVVQTEIRIDKVEFNIKVDDALFRLPK